MDENKRSIGPALIILAGCFWGSMGIFVRKLGEYGFSSIQIVSIRVTIAALAFSFVLFIKDSGGFKISLERYSAFSWSGIRKYSFLYCLLLYSHQYYAALHSSNPSLHFAHLDHDHVCSFSRLSFY